MENHVLTQSHRVFSRVEVEKWRKNSALELELQLELISNSNSNKISNSEG